MRPWETSTQSTSSLLYRHLNTHDTYGNVSGTQVLHLLLRLHLEEHENKDHEWEASEFTKFRVGITAHAIKGEGDPFDEHPGTVHYRPHNSKLNTNLHECHPFWLGLVQFWCIIVNKSGNEERKDEASDANPRDAQSPNEVMAHLTLVKEKSLCKVGGDGPKAPWLNWIEYRPSKSVVPGSSPGGVDYVLVAQLVRASILCRRSEFSLRQR